MHDDAERRSGNSGWSPTRPEKSPFTSLPRHGALVIYRMRIYQAVPEHLETFHRFFLERLLPVQQRHGARLVGRWQTKDQRVVAVWEYDDENAYARIDAAVRADPDAAAAQAHRRAELPVFFTTEEEVLMHSTLPE